MVHRVPSRVRDEGHVHGRKRLQRVRRERRGRVYEQIGGARAARERQLWRILRRIHVSVGVCGCRIDHRVWRRRRKMPIQRVFSVHRGVDCGHLPGRRQLGMEHPWLALSMDGD